MEWRFRSMERSSRQGRLATLLLITLVANGCGRGVDRALVWKYRRDSTGQVSAATDPAGRTTVLKQLPGALPTSGAVEQAGPTGSVTFGWDEQGRPESTTGPAGTTTYAFDDQHRLVRMAQDDAPAVELSYDAVGRPSAVRIGDLDHANYEYDYLGRLTGMKTPAGLVELRYGRFKDNTTFQSRTLPNGIVTTWNFDPSGRLSSLRHVGPGETVIASYACEYDAAGRLVKLVEKSDGATRSREYAYDAGRRLTGVAAEADRRWAYGYEPLGGRTSARGPDGAETAARFDWAGRRVEHGGKAVRHDALGNVTAVGQSDGDTFEYSADGRLVSARRGQAQATFVHDGDGQLAARQTAAGALRWVCSPMSDAFEPLAAVGDDGSRTLYLWDRGRPLAAIRYGRVEFFLADPLGSVRTIADESGAVVLRRDFDPFGVPLEPPTGDEPIPGFAGMFYDPVAALYLTPRRAYDPVLGQFLQRDPVHATPLGSVEDLSPYAYCANDPVNLVDHSGARAARPRDRYAGYDAGSRAVAERWDARVAAGTASRSRTIQGDRSRTTYYDENGDTQAWAAQNDPESQAWMNQQWRRSYVRARDSLDGLSREYAELVDRVGVIAAQQDPLAGMLQNARQRMDQFGPPPPDLLPRPVAGEPNAGLPSYRAYDSYTGELIGLGGYETARSRAGSSGGGSTRPEADPDAGSAVDGDANAAMDWVGGTPTPPRDPIDMSINDVVGGVAVPRRPPVDPGEYDFVGGVPTPRAGADDELTIVVDESSSGRRSDLADFSDWAVNAAAGRPRPRSDLADFTDWAVNAAAGRPRSDLSEFMDFVDGMSGASVPPVVTPDPPAYTPRGRPKSDLQIFRESIENGTLGGPRSDAGGEPISPSRAEMIYPHGGENFTPYLRGGEPSAVGGVWLGGAAASLPDMGPLAGVAVDDNGRLVLLSRDDARVNLPPLRLDDVVTIFRCVYEHGESPSVSIDNDPKNPDGPLCTVRHGPGTAETYVGWILFQCDRVLKCYGEGFDNQDGKPFRSRVPGFKSGTQIKHEIETADPDSARRKPGDLEWRRVWIMPAEVSRESARTGSLTLLEVPLMLNTKYQEIKAGKFQDVDRKPDNAWGRANTIADRWFTEHYDEIAEEFLLEPPAETGITGPVRIFSELKRIATIAAVAEALAAQGVPLPEWMRTYPVRPCPVDKTTPWLTNVEVPVRDADGTARTRKVNGGVSLTPPDDLVKTVVDSPRATAVAGPVARVTAAAPALQSVRVPTPGPAYRAVPLPGADTVDLGAARLAEVDLVVPFGGGQRLELVRQFNSFFQPGGPWGPTWTLDLPSLDVLMQRVKNTSEGWSFERKYRLTAPLGSIAATLRERRFVPELGIETTAPDRPGSVLGMLADADDPRIGVATARVAMRDGSRWHFRATAEGKLATGDPRAGLLAAVETGPTLIAYRWDVDRRLTKIEGFVGPKSMASIDLEYEGRGLLTRAVGMRGGARAGVTYAYAADGTLATVTTPRGTRRYAYRDGLVSSIHEVDPEGDRLIVAYEYGPGGRLEAMSLADGSRAEYRLARTPDGTRLETIVTDKSGARRTLAASFDASMTPREQALADGSLLNSEDLLDDTGSRTTLTLPDGRKVVEEASADGCRRDFSMPSGTRYRKEYDPATRTVTLSSGSGVLMRQTTRANGSLDALVFSNLALRPRYDDQNRLTGTMVTGPERQKSYSEWLEIEYDAAGRPARVTDNRGREDRIERAADGRSAVVVTNGLKTTIASDTTARTVTVSTSSKDVGRMAFDPKGQLASVSLERDGKRAEIEYAAGRPVRGQGFDGGETTYAYVVDGPAKGRLEQLTYPHGLVVRYGYDARGRLETATLGDVRRYRYQRDDSGNLLSFAVEPVGR